MKEDKLLETYRFNRDYIRKPANIVDDNNQNYGIINQNYGIRN